LTFQAPSRNRLMSDWEGNTRLAQQIVVTPPRNHPIT
jgi:hypothetical protein